jgi:hypothetical protein
VKGGDTSLPGDIHKKQYLCQIFIIDKFCVESDRYSQNSGTAGMLKYEKMS